VPWRLPARARWGRYDHAHDRVGVVTACCRREAEVTATLASAICMTWLLPTALVDTRQAI
jgi:hypothetical protein